jgi:hypothetical protein
VIDAVATYMRDSNANVGGAFTTSTASDDVMRGARADAADSTGAEPEGIASGTNMCLLGRGHPQAARRVVRCGDGRSKADHSAGPWWVTLGSGETVNVAAHGTKEARDFRVCDAIVAGTLTGVIRRGSRLSFSSR